MEEIAGWIAPAATMIAAVMTAANLGTRVTGWGFVVFTIGAIGWCVEAILTHQPNLLWSNAFLGVVDVVGVYRWLGQRAKLEDGARAAVEKSGSNHNPLFPVMSLEGRPVEGSDGQTFAHIVGAMAECASGRIAYLVVRRGTSTGLGAALRAISWEDMQAGETFRTRLSPNEIDQLPTVDPRDWPEREPRAVAGSGG
ncbi:PRC-barrel domain containing protein [Sphingomonas abietis]|uniref:PRC-barrel domain containing protein n=1 Tax=Sphingomonas abietis TaxID=3012344 RepID=A0ABY7NVJ9_9SPHN|nr:PRC-barrel domain containing protein [Sphingomonas abietis]WBO24451.1 PRC-barrel domain containing protein [Sphingomonas abietis]